jgi:hypothetical protein
MVIKRWSKRQWRRDKQEDMKASISSQAYFKQLLKNSPEE